MKVVAGLGNPGPKYETTRHNAGYLAIDRLVDDWKATGPSFAFQGQVYQAEVGGERIVLVKPATFMNSSGLCVGPLLKFYKAAPSDLIVIHDELDLKPMQVRLKTGGGAAGHNGLKSLDQHIGPHYHRVRIGIGHPAREVHESAAGKHARVVADYALQNFTDEELQALDPVLNTVKAAIEMIVRGEMTQAMQKFHTDNDQAGSARREGNDQAGRARREGKE